MEDTRTVLALSYLLTAAQTLDEPIQADITGSKSCF